MGRRSKAELYDLVERILGLYQEGKTIQEIEEVLREDGYDISREAIRRSLKSSREVAAVYRKSLDEAKILLETVKDNPNTDVIEVTNSLLAHKLFEFAKTVEELNFDDAGQFVHAVRQLSESQVRVAKLRLDYTKGFEAAKSEVLKAVTGELEKYPEIKERLAEIIGGLEVKS